MEENQVGYSLAVTKLEKGKFASLFRNEFCQHNVQGALYPFGIASFCIRMDRKSNKSGGFRAVTEKKNLIISFQNEILRNRIMMTFAGSCGTFVGSSICLRYDIIRL